METIFHSRLHHRLIRLRQGRRHAGKTIMINIFHTGHPRKFLKKTHEMSLAEMADTSQFLNAHSLRIMFPDITQHRFQLTFQLRIRGGAFIFYHISILIQKPEKTE